MDLTLFISVMLGGAGLAFGAFVASLDPEAAGWFRDDLAEAEHALAEVPRDRSAETPRG